MEEEQEEEEEEEEEEEGVVAAVSGVHRTDRQSDVGRQAGRRAGGGGIE